MKTEKTSEIDCDQTAMGLPLVTPVVFLVAKSFGKTSMS
jgi:hypothetical protein